MRRVIAAHRPDKGDEQDSRLVRGAEVIDPSALSQAERSEFIDGLYQLHGRIFDGVTKNAFISYVVDSPAKWTRIRIFQNSRKEWVGYCAVHRFHLKNNTRSCVVFRAEAGIIRQYRGRSMTLWFGFREAIKYRLMHPFIRLYYLGSFVHPSALYMFSKYFHQIYPRPDRPPPEGIKRLMLDMARQFRIEPVKGENWLVRKVGWITRESNQDRLFWQAHRNPVVRFYIELNPGYVHGNGLLSLVPLSFSNISLSLFRFIKHKLGRRLGYRRPGELRS